LWKASRIDVPVVTSGEGDSLLKEEDGHVMVEPLGVIVGVDTDGGHGEFTVLLGLNTLLEATGVILNNPHFQQIRTLDIFKLVGSSDDSVGSRGNVIFSVVWDDGTTSHKVVVSLENQAGPRHLVRLGLGSFSGNVSWEAFAALVSGVGSVGDVASLAARLPPDLVGLSRIGTTERVHA